MTGYRVSRTVLRGNASPFGIGWEQDPSIDDGHAHDWELVHLLERGENAIRCAVCHAPRCGSSTDLDPCMERRHHRDLHITLHGRFEPVGGMLPPEEAP